MADRELERYFSQSEKQLEIERVLQCFKLDPFAILELPYEKPDPKRLKMQYRKKSLMIHPDKVQHAHAEEAFALLKKAESELHEETRIKFLLSVVEEAKVEALRENGYKVKTQVVAATMDSEGKTSSSSPSAAVPGQQDSTDSASNERSKMVIESATSVNTEQYPFLATREGYSAVRAKVKEILIEMELRRRRQLRKELEAEGAEARRAEEESKLRKRKQEETKQWEATRDQRVSSWRDFQKKGGRKVKKIKRSGLD